MFLILKSFFFSNKKRKKILNSTPDPEKLKFDFDFQFILHNYILLLLQVPRVS